MKLQNHHIQDDGGIQDGDCRKVLEHEGMQHCLALPEPRGIAGVSGSMPSLGSKDVGHWRLIQREVERVSWGKKNLLKVWLYNNVNLRLRNGRDIFSKERVYLL